MASPATSQPAEPGAPYGAPESCRYPSVRPSSDGADGRVALTNTGHFEPSRGARLAPIRPGENGTYCSAPVLVHSMDNGTFRSSLSQLSIFSRR